MNILLIGWYGRENLGDDLLLIENLNRISQNHIVSVVGKPEGLNYFSKLFKIRIIDENCSRFKKFKYIMQHDVLLYGGGGLFSSTKLNLMQYSQLIIAFLLRKKVILIGIGIVPKKDRISKFIWKIICKKVVLLTVRDYVSKNFLEEIEKNNIKIPNYGDLYFANENTVKIPNKYYELMNMNKKIAAIVVAMPFTEEEMKSETVKERYTRLIKEWKKALSYLYQNNYYTFFFPFLISRDSLMIKDLNKSTVNNLSETLVFNRDYEISDINSYFAFADIAICMRFHSIVLAVKNKVPFIGICYDYKSEALMEGAGLTNFSLKYGIRKNSFFDVELDLEPDSLVNKVKELNTKKEIVKENISLVSGDFQTQAKKNYKELNKIIMINNI